SGLLAADTELGGAGSLGRGGSPMNSAGRTAGGASTQGGTSTQGGASTQGGDSPMTGAGGASGQGAVGGDPAGAAGEPAGSGGEAGQASELRVSAIAAGTDSTCALLNTGAVRCWGSSVELGYPESALNDIGDDETPAAGRDAEIGGPATVIAAGNDHVCALL